RGELQASVGLISNLISDKPDAVQHTYLEFLIVEQALLRTEQRARMDQAHTYLTLARREAVLRLAQFRAHAMKQNTSEGTYHLLEAQAALVQAQEDYRDARRSYEHLGQPIGPIFQGVIFKDEPGIEKELHRLGTELAV